MAVDVREKLWRFVKEAIHSWESDVNMSDHITDNLIAHGVTVQEWTSVKDKYPNHGDVVLICTKDKDVQVFQWDEVYAGWVGDRYNYSTKHVTHWQYLPQPPKGE